MERVIIKKNGRERVEISVSEYKGKNYLDIRNFYFDPDSNSWKPTPKGISIPVEHTRSVYRGIKQVGLPFFDLTPAVKEETGIKRREKDKPKKKQRVISSEVVEESIRPSKKKKADDKYQRKMQKMLTEIASEEATKATSKKKKSALDDLDISPDLKKQIQKIARRAADEVLSETNVTTIKKKKKKKKADDKEAWEGVKKRLKSAEGDLKNHIKELLKPIGPDGLTAKERMKLKSGVSAPTKKHKRPVV